MRMRVRQYTQIFIHHLTRQSYDRILCRVFGEAFWLGNENVEAGIWGQSKASPSPFSLIHQMVDTFRLTGAHWLSNRPSYAFDSKAEQKLSYMLAMTKYSIIDENSLDSSRVRSESASIRGSKDVLLHRDDRLVLITMDSTWETLDGYLYGLNFNINIAYNYFKLGLNHCSLSSHFRCI